MKTFKLKMLEIIDENAETYKPIQIPLVDGLIINREDMENRWLIEAFTDKKHHDFFRNLKEKDKEIIVHVKITTDLNEKATCITTIIGLNEIGDKINVLFLGNMVDQRTPKLEKVLNELIMNGNKGKSLLSKFKESLN